MYGRTQVTEKQQRTAIHSRFSVSFFNLISYIFQRESDKYVFPPSFPDFPACPTTVKGSIGRQILGLINTLTVIKQTGPKIPFSGSEKPHH